jgi:hypothetical protein
MIGQTRVESDIMTDIDHIRKLDELDRLLNDPDVPMDPDQVWALLAEVSQREPASRQPAN